MGLRSRLQTNCDTRSVLSGFTESTSLFTNPLKSVNSLSVKKESLAAWGESSSAGEVAITSSKPWGTTRASRAWKAFAGAVLHVSRVTAVST